MSADVAKRWRSSTRSKTLVSEILWKGLEDFFFFLVGDGRVGRGELVILVGRGLFFTMGENKSWIGTEVEGYLRVSLYKVREIVGLLPTTVNLVGVLSSLGIGDATMAWYG